MRFLKSVLADVESQKPGKRQLMSFNGQILHLIRTKVPELHFQKSNYTSYGIEGEFMFKQDDGRAGRYRIEIKKVGMT